MSRKYFLDCRANGAKWADDIHARILRACKRPKGDIRCLHYRKGYVEIYRISNEISGKDELSRWLTIADRVDRARAYSFCS